MFITNSLPELWLYYAILSLVVLGAGYFAVSFLPRTPRWMLVGLVAGAIWMPWFFTSPATTDVSSYSGIAPAIIIAALGVLGKQLSTAIIGVIIGALVGAWVALKLVKRFKPASTGKKGGQGKASNKGNQGNGKGKRSEPSV